MTKTFFQILELACVYKRKNRFGNATITKRTIEVDGIIYSETIYTTANVSGNKTCTPGDVEPVGHSITEFYYNMGVKSTFPKWFAHYEDLFTVDLKEKVDTWKVRVQSWVQQNTTSIPVIFY